MGQGERSKAGKVRGQRERNSRVLFNTLHRLNTVLSQISKVYMGSMSRDVHSCPHWLRPRELPPPLSPAFGLIYEGRYWSAKIDDISLYCTVVISVSGTIQKIGQDVYLGERRKVRGERGLVNFERKERIARKDRQKKREIRKRKKGLGKSKVR